MAYKILVGKTREKRLLVVYRHIQEYNIKMDLTAEGGKVSIRLAQIELRFNGGFSEQENEHSSIINDDFFTS